MAAPDAPAVGTISTSLEPSAALAIWGLSADTQVTANPITNKSTSNIKTFRFILILLTLQNEVMVTIIIRQKLKTSLQYRLDVFEFTSLSKTGLHTLWRLASPLAGSSCILDPGRGMAANLARKQNWP